MTQTASDAETFDVEFFFDPVCPFAWQTSRWLRIVAEEKGLTVDWRFISLALINREIDYDAEFPPNYKEGHTAGLLLLRVAAAIRAQHDRSKVGEFYESVGYQLWHQKAEIDSFDDVMATLSLGVDLVGTLNSLDLPVELAEEAQNERWDAGILSESELALSRTGRDVGTPIITFNGAGGGSFFGPVISTLPEPADAVAIYDSIATLVRFDSFSELKRSDRPPLDLPLLT